MRIHHEHYARKALHLLDTAKVGLQLRHFLFEKHDFLLGKKFEFPVGFHFFEFFKSLYARTHGLEIRQAAAQPTRVDIELTASFRFFLDRVLRLLLRAYKKNRLARFRALAYERIRFLDERRRHLQVDNVNIVSRRKDVLLHLGVPFSRLVSEVDACFQKLFHRDNCHNSIPPLYLPGWRYSRNDIRTQKFYGHGMRVKVRV